MKPIATNFLSDSDYRDKINATLDRWWSFYDLSTRSVGVFTLVLMDYMDERLARFFDPEHYPAHAALAVRQDKKALRDIQALAADLRRTCAPQTGTEQWPTPAVREAVKRYKKQGVEHDFLILYYTLCNYFLSQHIELPEPLFDLYLCICLVRLIDINVDSYSRALIDIDPCFADILNVPSPAADPAVPGKLTPLHLLADTDNRLHRRLRQTDPQIQREMSHRRFARTRPLREAITAFVNRVFKDTATRLPDTGRLMTEKELSPVGQASVIMLNRANKTDFIRRATEPQVWESFDNIERDYIDWLDANDCEHSLAAAHEWKLQSDVCGEAVAASVAEKRFLEAMTTTAVQSPAGRWLDVCENLEKSWVQQETEARRAFDIERDAMAKLHPKWSADKVEWAVSEIQYGVHESALMYDVEALRYHLEKHRPKGVTKKALQHERVQRRKAERAAASANNKKPKTNSKSK